MNALKPLAPPDEIAMLALYVEGFAQGTGDDRLKKAAKWLERLSENICAQGYIGCKSGRHCISDHK